MELTDVTLVIAGFFIGAIFWPRFAIIFGFALGRWALHLGTGSELTRRATITLLCLIWVFWLGAIVAIIYFVQMRSLHPRAWTWFFAGIDLPAFFGPVSA
jgi:hypothetical protein